MSVKNVDHAKIYGIELEIIEMIFLRFGRENEEEIKDYYGYSPQYPVSRYGFGFKLPIKRLFNLNNEVELSLDYSHSDWDKINEDNPRESFPIFNLKKIKQSAFSIKLGVQL